MTFFFAGGKQSEFKQPGERNENYLYTGGPGAFFSRAR